MRKAPMRWPSLCWKPDRTRVTGILATQSLVGDAGCVAGLPQRRNLHRLRVSRDLLMDSQKAMHADSRENKQDLLERLQALELFLHVARPDGRAIKQLLLEQLQDLLLEALTRKYGREIFAGLDRGGPVPF